MGQSNRVWANECSGARVRMGTSIVAVSVWLSMAMGRTEGSIQAIDPASITSRTSTITFSEVAVGTTNPTIFSVRFGSHFVGQVVGGIPNSLLDTTPDSPLTMAVGSPNVATSLDFLNPTMPGLGGRVGTTFFTTPIAFQFGAPVVAVGFTLGHLDAAGTTVIEAYDAAANSLGTILNSQAGFEDLGIRDSSGASIISGISIYIQEGMDWEGFTIDNVFSGIPETVIIPEPASIPVWGLLLAGAISFRFLVPRKRQS